MAMRRAAPKTELEQMNERLQRSESLLQKLDEDDITKQKRVKNVDYIDSLTDILGHMKIENNGRANYIYAMEGKTPKEDSFPPITNTTIPIQTTLFVLSEPPLLSCHQIPDLSNDDNNFSDLVSHLVDLYFNHVHPYLPIIHKANFLRRLHDKTNPISPLLLYAVFAMGSRFSDDVRVRLDPMKPETAGFSYFNRANELLDDFLDAPRLSTIQAQLLMMKFQENTQKPGFFFRSWLSFGSIIRMAEELGLNKNFDEWNLRLSTEDTIVRKRVWQVCFLFDQFMSGAQGRNPVVSLSNADIELPRKEHYDDEQEFQLQTDFIHLVRLTKILASVMSFISPAGSGCPPILQQSWNSNPKLSILDNAIDAWMAALPQRLKCQQLQHQQQQQQQQNIGENYQQNVLLQNPLTHFAGFLNLLYYTVIILLHRPFITKMENNRPNSNSNSNSNSSSPDHLVICTNAANNASQLASVMLERWSPQVFQYTLRGGNYGVYCLVASSMIHLVNMSSPDLRFSKPAHDNLLRTLSVLKICVEHSSARELRDKVHGLEVAFSAQQSLGLMLNGGVPVTTNNLTNATTITTINNNINNLRKQPLSPSTTYPSSQLKNRLSSINSDITISQHLSNSLCDGDNSNINFTYFNASISSLSSSNSSSSSSTSSPSPQFNEHNPLYLMPSSPSSPQLQNHHHLAHQQSHDHDPMTSSLNFGFTNTIDGGLITSSINQLPITPVNITNTNPETYNTILSCNNNNCNVNNSTSSPSSSLDPTSTNYWDTDHFLIWNQLSNGRHHQHHQLPPPEYGPSSPCNSPPTTIVEPVIVASQNNEDLIPISFSI